MSTTDKNKLDELFKDGLNVPDGQLEYNEADWDNLNRQLGKGRKGGVVLWLPYLSAVAAVLLLFIGWWFFKPEDTDKDKPKIAVNQFKKLKRTLSDGKSGKTLTIDNQRVQIDSVPESQESDLKLSRKTGDGQLAKIKHVKATDKSKNTGAIKNPATGQEVYLSTTPTSQKNTDSTERTAAVKTNYESTLPGGTTKASAIAQAPAGQSANSSLLESEKPAMNADPTPKKADKIRLPHGRPQLALSVIASPDINGVGSFKQSQWGKNVGLLFSVGLGKKLTVSTGLAYSQKPYLTAYSNYVTSYKFKTDPNSVMADCRVLDIPLNVDYRFYNKGKNAFSVGTGLSSYFMLRETYTYQFASGKNYGPSDYTVVNQNRHILGVLNLNTTYQRQLSNKFSVGVQPYLKIPLTDIGNSRVKLQSAGVAVGVSWNINSNNP